MTDNKQVYILSLEASDIYSHMHRETSINYDYCGMIPYSLELLKLRKEGLKVKYIKSRDKEISNDIINVKFNQKVKSGLELKKLVNKKIEGSENEKYTNKLKSFVNLINIDDTKWSEISPDKLRENLYLEGFTINYYNKKTEKTTPVDYVVYKRSSSKSRTGQCLFIKKSLYNKMIKWSRMNLPLRKNMEIDLAGLLAYESLVGSSLENVIKINPDNILMVDDVNSKFMRVSNVVRTGGDGFLDSFKEKVEISNSLFDGESLLDSKYFEDGVSMKLLRNHMFKSAAFNCNIQEFLIDNKPKDVCFEDWEISDMFGNSLLASKIELICTPSSLKALKFSSVLGDNKQMWEYWKKVVTNDGNLFGVCKHDKKSKLGYDENGNIMQQTSYQMINCLPIQRDDINKLTQVEKEYISRLKNDNVFFMEKVKESKTLINSNEMLFDLYTLNKNFIHTKLFKEFRKGFIRNHINHSKKGKVKLVGDYCVMLGNPLEFLYHSIGKFNPNNFKLKLKDNEVYTKLFQDGKELVGFRNPNTSPSNVLIAKNKYIPEIDKYFNLTDNIVCVNACDFELQDMLSGCDYDSDTVVLFDDEKLLELGKRCYGRYDVCTNKVESQKKKYKLNKECMFDIDNQLSTSQRNIGKVVNLGQFCMSAYWDELNNNGKSDISNELLKKVDVMTVLSGISIDMAKKFYDIDIDQEIRNVEKLEYLKSRKKKPNFWKYVSQSKTILNRIKHYDCPMDYLIEDLESITPALPQDKIFIESFVNDYTPNKVNYKQIDKIKAKLIALDKKIKSENASNLDKSEKYVIIEESLKEVTEQIGRLKLNEDTINALIQYFIKDHHNLLMRLLSIIHKEHKESLLKTFKNGDFEHFLSDE